MADKVETANDRDMTNWWEDSLDRRDAGKRIAVIGAGAALLTSSGVLIGCGGDDAGVPAADAKDAIDVQKADGWNVGADNASLRFTNASPTDSKESLDGWKSYTDPAKLKAAWAPADSGHQKYVSAELLNALGEPSLQTSIQPVHSSSMDEAYSRGLGMKELLQESENPAETGLVVDLPGPESVAFAAALADYADVVLTLDNWPHPHGVVPSHETLGALLYYAAEVEEKKAERPENAPTMFVMDSNRLTEYKDSPNAFDNRYIATMPTAQNLQSEGVKGLIYATPDDKRTNELDDLNEDFVNYREAGVSVTMMPLTDFRPPTPEMIAEHGAIDSTEGNSHHRRYYYGGHPYFSPFFFMYYPMFTPYRSYNYANRTAPRTVRRPTYTPSRRPTMFSSSTTGGRSGVGKQKPSGFGRVSTRTVNGRTSYTSSSSSRARSGSRSGRSGSFGRSGGRSSSG